MPELPEVETVRRGLMPILGQQIVACAVRRRDVVRDRSGKSSNPRRGPIDPARLGVGAQAVELVRKGKQLAVIAQQHGRERVLLIQLGMSGQVSLIDTPRIRDAKHVHVVWTLDDTRRIAFRDPRRFGGITLLRDRAALERAWATLGPDALSIDAKALRESVSGSSRTIKAALLDQRVLAGVGNIYADESLHRAGIDPRAICASISDGGLQRLSESISAVLRDAVEARGSTLRDYRDASDQPGGAQLLHRVYNRAGQPCRNCGSIIESTRIAQRSTCWCPTCQH